MFPSEADLIPLVRWSIVIFVVVGVLACAWLAIDIVTVMIR